MAKSGKEGLKSHHLPPGNMTRSDLSPEWDNHVLDFFHFRVSRNFSEFLAKSIYRVTYDVLFSEFLGTSRGIFFALFLQISSKDRGFLHFPGVMFKSHNRDACGAQKNTGRIAHVLQGAQTGC